MRTLVILLAFIATSCSKDDCCWKYYIDGQLVQDHSSEYTNFIDRTLFLTGDKYSFRIVFPSNTFESTKSIFAYDGSPTFTDYSSDITETKNSVEGSIELTDLNNLIHRLEFDVSKAE